MSAELERQVDRVIEFLAKCGEIDIESGVGYVLGNGTPEKIAKFRRGIEVAITGAVGDR